MIPREILEVILIFSMSVTFIMLAMLFYPYVKKWIYPHINKNKDKNISIKPKTYPIKNKSDVKDKIITKDKSKNLNISNLDLINRTQKVPNRQNIDKNSNKYSFKGEYNKDSDDKGKNLDVNKWINKDKGLKWNAKNENYDFVAKSWNEPMLENQKETVNHFKNTAEDLNEFKHEKLSSDKSKQKISFLADDESINNEHINNRSSNNENNNLKNDDLNNKDLKTAKTKPIHDEQVKPSDILSTFYDSSLEKISIGKHVIFNYNNESYLSEILEIKHDNIKILYRGSYKWIQLSDIKKIL
ncbi:MAG: hypothetical protein LBB45_08790 [Methanobrevibacter sp.]|jgi:hypothetical protein|nr:hypothetical protein [Candidatus Methanovirga basalitermitum]